MNKKQIITKIEDLSTKSFKEVVGFLNSSSCYRYNKFKCKYPDIFWQSELPVKWVNEFSKSPLTNELIFGYFSSSQNANTEFLKAFSLVSPNILIRIIKLTRAFEKKQHWDSFTIFKTHESLKFQMFYKELNFVKTFLDKWNKDAKPFISIVEQLDYEDILVHTVSYYEKFKRSSMGALNNRNNIVSKQMNLNYVLNEILNIKKKKNDNIKKLLSNKYSVSEFEKLTKEVLPPTNPVQGIELSKYLPTEEITDKKRLIRNTIEFFFAFHIQKYQIEIYLGGFSEFETISNLEAELTTNKYYSAYQRNDKKSSYAELLFYNKASESKGFLNLIKDKIDPFDKEILLDIFADKEYYNYLKLPLIYKTKHNGIIDLEKVFKLLKVFSVFFMPSGRNILSSSKDSKIGKTTEGYHIFKRKKPKEFTEYFKEDYIICYDEKELLFNCEMYFNWDREEIINIIDFLTTDLNVKRNFKIDFLKRPLIKIGTQYFWLSSLLRDIAWNIAIHRRIIEDGLNNHNEQSAKMESQIANEFIKAGFNAISSHCYKTNTHNGEIDTMAYKDNTLFLIELKTTYIEENIIRSAKIKSQQFNKAQKQLSNAIKYVDTNFNEIAKIRELNIDCSKEEFKIIPLIVSNIYDTDGLFINKKILKISMFELMVILNNDLSNLLNSKTGKAIFDFDFDISVPHVMQFINQNAHDYKKNKIKTDKETCNLWKDKNNCSANDLISAITNNKVWILLDDLQEFKYNEPVKLMLFNKNDKILT